MYEPRPEMRLVAVMTSTQTGKETRMKTADDIFNLLNKADDGGVISTATITALSLFLSRDHVRALMRKEGLNTEEEIDEIADKWEQFPLNKKIARKALKKRVEKCWRMLERGEHTWMSIGVEAIRCYLWLMDKTELFNFAADHNNYCPFGVPILKKVCSAYDFEVNTSAILRAHKDSADGPSETDPTS